MSHRTRAEIISALRQGTKAVAAGAGDSALPLGLAPIDDVIPGGGLGFGNLHELSGDAATGFAAAILGRLEGPVLWCAASHHGRPLYPPGLQRFGLDPGRLVLARAARKPDALWVAEEAMKSGALRAVVLEADFTVPLAQSRRLQLGLEASRCLGLLLYQGGEAKITCTTAARTRWRVSSCPSPKHREGPCWRLELTRNKGGPTGQWEVSWHDTAHRLTMVSQTAGRPSGTRDAA